MAEAKAWVMIPISKNKGAEIEIDMHPLVLCKDCKFSKTDWEKAVWCEREDCRRHENWFCADGEQK